MRGGALGLVLLAVACASPVEHVQEGARLRAPSGADEPDLGLHHHWHAARVRQQLTGRHRTWTFRQHPDFVVLDGEGRRALLLMPSAEGRPSLAAFAVALPAAVPLQFVTWVALDPRNGVRSDGVEFAVAVGDAAEAPERVPLAFARLPRAAGTQHWREVRIDLAPFAGTTVWIVLASRDAGSRRGDWLLFGDPRIHAVDDAGALRVALASPDPESARGAAVPWSAATVFKPYSLFNEEAVRWFPPTWVRDAFPWLTTLRIFSALGANWGPSLDESYDGARPESPPAHLRWEERWARDAEVLRLDGDTVDPARLDEDDYDWAEFDRLTGRIADSGLGVHLNLAGVPEAFTGGRGVYQSHHVNELPVTDVPAWQRHVTRLFRHLRAQPWFGRAEFSFFSEPNCRWTDVDGSVRPLGFQGDAAEYARQYLATWQAMRPWLDPEQVVLGPWVVEPDPTAPALDNLARYLETLVGAFAAAGEPLPGWKAFSFNLYETPRLGLDDFAAYKLDYVRALLPRLVPDRALPIHLDEFGVHPLVATAFREATDTRLDTMQWEMSWHAEMLALLLDRRVARAASWLPVFMVELQEPIRAYAAHAFLSAVVGGVTLEAGPDGMLAVERTVPLAAGRPRTDGSLAPGPVHVRLASRHADRIGWLWLSEPSRHRLAIWRHPRAVLSDERAATHRARKVRFALPPGERWQGRALGFTAQPVPRLGPDQDVRRLGFRGFPGLPAIRLVEGETATPVRLALRPGDVVFVDLSTTAR